MDATREIYWNVGHGAILPMYLLTFATFALLASGIWRRLPLYRQGRPLQRLDQLGVWIKRMVGNLLTQRSVRRGALAGTFHSFYGWDLAPRVAAALSAGQVSEVVAVVDGGFEVGCCNAKMRRTVQPSTPIIVLRTPRSTRWPMSSSSLT